MGWYYDAKDMKWYYLNQFTGGMATGCRSWAITGISSVPEARAESRWDTLYVNEITPDGYMVDENGRWMRETP